MKYFKRIINYAWCNWFILYFSLNNLYWFKWKWHNKISNSKCKYGWKIPHYSCVMGENVRPDIRSTSALRHIGTIYASKHADGSRLLCFVLIPLDIPHILKSYTTGTDAYMRLCFPMIESRQQRPLDGHVDLSSIRKHLRIGSISKRRTSECFC